MEARNIAAIIQGIAPIIKDEVEALQKQIAALSARVVELEAQRDEMKYCGVWRPEKIYTPGSFATCDGAMWHANRKTAEKPGASGDWTMCAKSGLPVASRAPMHRRQHTREKPGTTRIRGSDDE